MNARVLVLAGLLGGCTATSAPAPFPVPAPASTSEATAPDTLGTPAKSPYEPYRTVIPATAQSDTGLFRTHRVKEKLYYEIPRAELGREMLWVARIARAQSGTGYGGQGVTSRMVRWERAGDRVLLREVLQESIADSTRAVYRAVEAASLAPVIRAFEIKTVSPDSAPVIDVTSLFLGDVEEFSPKRMLRASALDASRSMLEEVLAFPTNVEVRALLTFSGNGTPGAPGTVSTLMHHSMVRLPEEPMRPRLADERVGFFTVEKVDYGTEEHRAVRREYVTRWRLEPSDPEAHARGELVEPKKPIVYYIDRATPEPWRPWLKRGVESWSRAFEKAGFRNAIVAKDAPSTEEAPDWHPEDARHSVIRWLPSETENAAGPHVHDPRSGEILEADIRWYHNVLKLLRDWYFVQAAPLDPRARSLPLPDSLMGRLVEYVAAHEVGHTLGLAHNMKASSAYPVDSLRSATFTARYGTEASIMDYGRFNYVAQPGDGASLVPVIGPYDEFAIEWGYTPLPEAATAEAERALLEPLVRRQEEDPRLRFGHADGVDPTAQTEDLGDDPVRATELGLRNLRRTAALLVPAATRAGEGYGTLRELYDALVQQWTRELGHVVTLVGGVERQEKRSTQAGVVYAAVARERQGEAVAFLQRHAFVAPAFLLDPEVLRRLESSGAVERVRHRQASLLAELLDRSRMERLVEQEALHGAGAYPVSALLRDVREGLWSELAANSVRIDPFRRNVQRVHLDLIAGHLGGGLADGTVRPALRGELRVLKGQVGRAVERSADAATRLHLEEIGFEIERLLDPK